MLRSERTRKASLLLAAVHDAIIMLRVVLHAFLAYYPVV